MTTARSAAWLQDINSFTGPPCFSRAPSIVIISLFFSSAYVLLLLPGPSVDLLAYVLPFTAIALRSFCLCLADYWALALPPPLSGLALPSLDLGLANLFRYLVSLKPGVYWLV